MLALLHSKKKIISFSQPIYLCTKFTIAVIQIFVRHTDQLKFQRYSFYGDKFDRFYTKGDVEKRAEIRAITSCVPGLCGDPCVDRPRQARVNGE